MRIPILSSILLLFLLAYGQRTAAQCTPDTEPPTSVCIPSLDLVLDANQAGSLSAATLNSGSYDNCNLSAFYLNDGPPSASLPTATVLDFDADDIGTHDVTLWVVDEAGNYNHCTAQITVMQDCGNGSSNPVLACNDLITLQLDQGDSVLVYPGLFLEGSNYCSNYNINTFQIGVGGPPGVTADYFVFDSNDEGFHSIQVRDVITGNSCWGELEIALPCVIDSLPPIAYCPTLQQVNVSNGDVTISVTDPGFDGVNECSVIERIELAPASASPPTTTSITFGEDDFGTNELVFWAIDEAGNYSTCTSFVSVDTCESVQTLACNDFVTIYVESNGTPTELYPAAILEGGPYCANQFLLNIPALNIYNSPSFQLDSSHVGQHTVYVESLTFGNSCWGTLNVVAVDCNNDVTPPTPVCLAGLSFYLQSNGEYELFADDLNAGSFDQCSGSLQFSLEPAPASAMPPTTNSITYDASNVGINNVVLWVIDDAGNADYCETSVIVSNCPAIQNMACSDLIQVEVSANQPTYLYPDDILEGGPYCLDDMVISFITTQQFLDFLTLDESHVGTQPVQVLNMATGNSCWSYVEITSACSNDTLPPTAICDEMIVAQLSANGPNLTIIEAEDLNDSSYDNCSEVHFTAEIGNLPSNTAPSATAVSFNAVGLYNIQLWVTDDSGNSQTCPVQVEVIPPKCTPDNTAPYFTYVPLDTVVHSDDLAAINFDPENFEQLNQYFGEAQVWDYCGLDTVVQAVSVVLNNCGSIKTLTRQFLAIDEAGNTAEASQTISVETDFSVNLPADYLPGDAGDPQEVTFVMGNGTQLAATYEDLAFNFNCDTITDFIHRTWTVLNWCSADPNGQPLVLDRRDMDSDGKQGDAFSIWSNNDEVYLLDSNGNQLQQLGSGTGMFSYLQVIRYNYQDTLWKSWTGRVYRDDNASCSPDTGEPGLENWRVKAVGNNTGRIYTTSTTTNGIYGLDGICVDDTELLVSLDVPFNYGQNCPTTWTVALAENSTAEQDIPVQLNTECALMEVSLATPYLRRCFQNIYTVNYCNYSASTIEDTWVEVTLDSFMGYLSSTIPGTLLNGNTFSFATGDLDAGQCSNFLIYFDLSCEASLGQTHCTEASIYPDTLCPQNANWSGANIEVEGNCVNDEVILTIRNTGTGNMTAALDYIVVEDVLMFDNGSFNLGAGQSMQLAPIPANGATWRLEAEQAPAHPYPGNVAVALEGCDGINELGLVNLFPVENPNPFIAVDCQENRGSFDPNDKQAVPVGYGEEHFINQNTDIEYTIRFQNTGTDTAFTVVIEDALSPHLDPASIRPGASSHAYAYEMRNGNTVHFTFGNILLPDSSINLAASQGFVKFVAKQKPNVALGSVIENTAAIYFDFNEPITTNRVFHTIGEDFIEVLNSVGETTSVHGQPTVFPNPAIGAVTFALPLELGENARFLLHDQLGKLAYRQAVSGDKFRFERRGMTPGIYFYSIENEGVVLFTGKVVLK